MNYIETVQLDKVYNDQKAVNKLDIHIKKGEVYGFIGKNGAGKTTTINMLLSLIHKTSGAVIIDGKKIDFTDVDYKKEIGYVPDVPIFPNHLNNKEYLSFTCEIFGIDKNDIKKKISEVLDFVGLEPSNKRISQYSRGMKQRLAIAQALIHDPQLIIMDEPTSALDPIGRKDVMDIILKLKGKKTIFYSTHILEDVKKVCDRIGLLDNGKLIIEDDISSIQSRYLKENIYIESDISGKELFDLLKKNNLEKNIEIKNNGILCKINGENNGLKILNYLLENKIRVRKYEEVEASLEDIFMEVTR
ncbi:ATP-binding cassette domain-containing protein [Candidatus Izemoplasma sp. B36]|uniref:ABC transporter ATP-binding protein n=1 Tax=Candidatus Izemoplasma sp. B36 TaxID=3242468 RepID=UPI0035578831